MTRFKPKQLWGNASCPELIIITFTFLTMTSVAWPPGKYWQNTPFTFINIRVRGLGAATTEFDLVSDESREWKYLSNSMHICAPNSPNYCIEICQFKFLVTIVMPELEPVELRRSTRESYQLLGQITVIDGQPVLQ